MAGGHRLWGWRLAIAIIATQVLGDVVNCVRGDLLRGGTGVIIAGGLLLFSLAIKDQSRVCLESLSKKFENEITAERGGRGNFKIGSGEDIFERPNYAPFLSQT